MAIKKRSPAMEKFKNQFLLLMHQIETRTQSHIKHSVVHRLVFIHPHFLRTYKTPLSWAAEKSTNSCIKKRERPRFAQDDVIVFVSFPRKDTQSQFRLGSTIHPRAFPSGMTGIMVPKMAEVVCCLVKFDFI